MVHTRQCHAQNAYENEFNTIDHDKVQLTLQQYKDAFPDDLPGEINSRRFCLSALVSHNSTTNKKQQNKRTAKLLSLHARHIGSANLKRRSAKVNNRVL